MYASEVLKRASGPSEEMMRQGISRTFTLCRRSLSEAAMRSTFVLVSAYLAFLLCGIDASIMVSADEFYNKHLF